MRAALTARKRKLLTLYATETALPRINELAQAAGLEPRLVDSRDLERRLGPEAVHQGLLLEARPLPEADISDIVSVSGVVLALDQITDPHNVGAILRTACAFNVDAVIVTERHSPEFSGVLAKAASGALEFVTIVSVVNLARALDDLAERGYARVGLDFGRRRIALDHYAVQAAGARARRRGQGIAAPHARTLRRRRAARSSGPDQEPQCVERLRRGVERRDDAARVSVGLGMRLGELRRGIDLSAGLDA